MTTDADDQQARKDARWARYQAGSRRTQAKIHTGLAVLWAALAIARWLDDGDRWLAWAWTVIALGYAALAIQLWRRVRRDERATED